VGCVGERARGVEGRVTGMEGRDGGEGTYFTLNFNKLSVGLGVRQGGVNNGEYHQ